jgi:hypothetical protein
MTSNRQDLKARVADFLSAHRAEIKNVTDHASHVFEAFCFVIFARHYENIGYRLVPRNLIEGKFRFRYTTNGLPWRYSYFAVYGTDDEGQSEIPLFEIWHNQKVAGAWVETGDEERALFAVDIAVTRAGALPANLPFNQPRSNEQYWVGKSDLVTFGEAKKLAGYPMLLAQFLGIVHEIKPEFIGAGDKEVRSDCVKQGHPPPTLLTANVLTSGAVRVLATFQQRNLKILVVDNVTGRPEQDLLDSIIAHIERTRNHVSRTQAAD